MPTPKSPSKEFRAAAERADAAGRHGTTRRYEPRVSPALASARQEAAQTTAHLMIGYGLSPDEMTTLVSLAREAYAIATAEQSQLLQSLLQSKVKGKPDADQRQVFAATRAAFASLKNEIKKLAVQRGATGPRTTAPPPRPRVSVRSPSRRS